MPIIKTAGYTEYRNDAGQLHREDGPAVENVYSNHWYRKWYVNGKLHRIDGPAVEWNNGNKAWWIEGKLHRTDGPAVEWGDGTKEYYIDGLLLCEYNPLELPKTFVIDGKTFVVAKNNEYT